MGWLVRGDMKYLGVVCCLKLTMIMTRHKGCLYGVISMMVLYIYIYMDEGNLVRVCQIYYTHIYIYYLLKELPTIPFVYSKLTSFLI